MRFFRWIAGLLFPPKCVLCGRILEKNETDLCHACRIDSPDCMAYRRKFTFLDGWAAIWYYEGLVRESILRYKFRGVRAYAQCYGRMLAMKITQEYPDGFDALTWIPISSQRMRQRGFDQVALLAEAVGKELAIRPQELLKKIRNNPPQSGISGEAERRANVLGAYRVTDPDAVRGKRILILDDVITTGATVSEAARMLLTAGAQQVYCGAVAVVRRDGKNSR